MGFSVSGRVAAGAQDALLQLMAERRMEEQMRRQEEQQRLQQEIQRRQMDRQEARDAANDARQAKQDERQGRQDRRVDNADGVRSIMGELIRREGLTPETRQQLIGMVPESGESLPLSLLQEPQKKEPRRHAVTVPGPSGPMRRLVDEDDPAWEQGIPEYREPKQPPAPQRDPIADYLARKEIDAKFAAPPSAPKMPAAMASRVAEAQTSLGTLDQLETGFKDAYVGPAAGRYNAMERDAPGMLQRILPDAPKGFADFAAANAALKNDVIRAVTGAAVGVQEQDRIMGQIPDVADTPENWRAKAKITRDNLQRLIANIVRAGGGAEAAPGDLTVPGLGGASAPGAVIEYVRDANGKLVRKR